VTRTIRLLLNPTPEQASAMAETARQFTEAFNAVCAWGWENTERNGVRLHHATYRDLKTRLPALVSDLHCQARVKATESLKSAFTLRLKGRKVGAPRSVACPPRLNKHTFKLDWSAGTARLSTTEGRTTVPFSVPAFSEKWAGGKPLTADLIQRDGRWWLHVAVEVPTPKIAATEEVVGVDLGLSRPAVTSNNRFLGQRSWRRVEERNLRLRRCIQAKGTKSAKRHLKKMRRRQARFRRDCDHVLSKQIVAAVEPGGTVVLEDLKHIRSRAKQRRGGQSRRLHGWSFAQLQTFVRYKAEEAGVTVALVNPAHTSQTCSSCGHVARNNRRSQSAFVCRECGFSLHADLNAARNIAAKYRSDSGMSGAAGLSVKQPTVGSRVQHGSLASCSL
jgi:IS605 OrfB family transposase